MKMLMALALLSSLSAAPSLAGPKIVRPPSVGSGEALGVDPYVAAFQKEMAAIKASMVALGTAIQAIAIPPGTRSGALAAKAAVAAQFAGLAGLEARAEAERLKMVDHINGIKHDGLALRPAPKAATFAAKSDAGSLRPKDDRIFKGPAKEAAAASPSFQPMNSRLSYNAGGGGPGGGFGMEMPMPTPGGATDAGALGGAISAGPSAAAGGGAGAGVGAAIAGGAGASAGKSAADAKPSVNPSAESLSKNSSDVAQKAAAEKKRREEELKAAAEKRAADEKAERQRMQQMMMQALQATVQVVAQAAQAVQQANQQANQKADSSAASAPPGS